MKLTNKNNLPQALYDAVKNDNYSKQGADFSITELLKPPRQRALQIKHEDDIEEDVENRLWSLLGQAVHVILERANKNDLVEKRFFVTVQGKTISGQIDSLELRGGILSDWKVTSVWGFTGNKPAKPEFIQQMNLQRYLLFHNNIEVKELQIVAMLRDWQLSKAELSKGSYPRKPIVIQPIEVWDNEDTECFIADRIYRHEQAILDLPECSSEETWQGRRCASYCQVNSHCSQYQKMKQAQKEMYI